MSRSQGLLDQIARGEDMANLALRKAFDIKAASDRSNPLKPESVIQAVSCDKDVTLFKADDHVNDGKRHLLLACSGSVATIKLPNMLKSLSSHSHELSIRVILTKSASHFLSGQAAEQPSVKALRSISGVDGVYQDEDEWDPLWTRGAPILHIELRRWSDALVIAPLSANTLAKMVHGLCDNLLTSVIRAWDTEGVVGFDAHGFSETDGQHQGSDSTNERDQSKVMRRDRKMIVVAPAMNTAMWRHPLTGQHIRVLEEQWPWVKVLRPVEKSLACGDVGTGAMKEWSDIVTDVENLLHLGSNRLIAGPT